MLTPQLAYEIYAQKLIFQAPTNFGSCFEAANAKLKGKSNRLAKQYKVSAKTIRDIWNRRTWTFATCNLWREEVSKSAEGAPYSQVIVISARSALNFDKISINVAVTGQLSPTTNYSW